MSEIVVETTPTETVIEIEGGPVLTTTVEQELQTVIEVPSDPVVIDLNSGARGEPGSAIHTGAAYPASMIGQDGDLYVVTDGSVQAGFVFLKENGVWEQQGSIRGPAGGIDVVNGYTGPIVTLVKGDVGLGNVDNTRDADKPVSVPQQQALDKKIKYDDFLQYSNPFGGKRLYLNELHNLLFNAESRWTVTGKFYRKSDDVEVGTLSASQLSNLFDGDYESNVQIPLGQYMLVNITFPSVMPGYPYGYFYVSHYYANRSESQSARFYFNYVPQGGPGWHTLPKENVQDFSTQQIVRFRNDKYNVEQMEFRVDSPDSGTPAWVTQIEMQPDRPGNQDRPFVDKYKPNALFDTTSWRIGSDTNASITPAGVITGVSFVGNGGSLTGLTKTQVGLANVTNDAQVTVATTQTITGVKTFSQDVTLSGTTVVIRSPDSAGGWARGLTWKTTDGSAVTAGIGLLGAGTTPTHIYLGHGANPYDGGTGLKILTSGAATFSSTVTATSFIGSGASLTGLTKTQVGLANVTNDAQVTVATAQTVTGAKTFTGAIVVPAPTAPDHAATKGYIDSIVDAAPGTLDTLNELAAALGDDPNFATTVTNSIATKEPIINAGTTAQYWRGDKTWQTLDKSAVGLSLINNVAQVEIAGAQTITGAKTFSGATVFSGPLSADGATNLRSVGIKPVGDHGYVSFYSRDAAPSTRTAYVGVGSAGSTTFTIANEMTNGGISLSPNGTGAVVVTSGGLTVTGTITGNGSGITAINGSNIASGTVADARLSTNVALLAGTQTFSGAKTFSALITASAGVTVTGTVTATTFSGSGASLTSIPAGNLTGTVAQARLVQNITRVVHGATASTARPTGATYVEWIGSVVPTNMATNDTWINTATNGNTTDNRPAGSVMASASAKPTAPAGWYWMEGQEILISGDTALYNELTNNGTTFPYGANTNGSGAAGSTHFRLPNSKGKVIAHADGTTEFASVGTSFGAKTVTLTAAQSGVPAHNHGVNDPGHYHTGSTSTGITFGINRVMSAAGSGVAGNHGVGYAGGIVTDLADGSNSLWSAHIHTFTTSTVGTGITTQNNTTQNASQSHNNIQPTLTLRYMIKR